MSQQCLEHKHTSKIPNPKFPQPRRCHPSGLHRAGTALSPPPCRVLGVFRWRGPKSSQMLCQEPQSLVTTLILRRGLDGRPQLGAMLGDTPPLWQARVRLVQPPWPCWCSKAELVFFGCRPPRAWVGVTHHHAQLAAAAAQSSVCVQPSPGSPQPLAPRLEGVPTFPVTQAPSPRTGVPQAAPTPRPAPAAP